MKYVPDALLVAGFGLVSWGAWTWFEPAGFLVGGMLLLAGGLAIGRAQAAHGVRE